MKRNLINNEFRTNAMYAYICLSSTYVCPKQRNYAENELNVSHA